MNRPGFTVEPSLMIDPETGEEFISFNDANIINHDDRLAAIADVQAQEQYAFHEDPEGTVTHDWAVDHPEQYDEDPQYYSEDAFEGEDEDDDEESGLDPDFVQYIYDEMGGEEEYIELMEWADQNLNEDVIDNFNQVIDSGDKDYIIDAIGKIVDLYNLSIEDSSEFEDDYLYD